MKNNVTVLKDIAYGKHERNKIDVYIPEKPQSRSGFILIIHGGGWTSGDKSIHIPDAEYWSEKGYICGIMNYRFVSETVNISDELDDITSALKKAKDVCREYGSDLTDLLLSGGSAGAHLSLLYAYTRQDVSPLKPAAVFCQCPPVDCAAPDFLTGISGEFEDWKNGVLSCCCGIKITKENFGSEEVKEALRNISPLKYVSASCVPTAVCHGIHDTIVPYNQAILFTEILEKYDVRHDLITYENSDHALDKDPDSDLKAKELMAEYLRSYF